MQRLIAFLWLSLSSVSAFLVGRDAFQKQTTVLSLAKRQSSRPFHATSTSEAESIDLVPRRDLFKTLAAASTVLLLPCRPAVAAKDLKEDYRQGTAALGDSDTAAPLPREAYQKLPSGVVYADIRTGQGETVKIGSKVNMQWVLRRSNGYFVDSSEVSGSVPFIFTVGDSDAAIQGVNEGVIGMKTGGVRRLLIPPSLAYARGLEDGLPGPLPVGFGPRQQMRRVQGVRKDVPGEYVYLEVQVTRVR